MPATRKHNDLEQVVQIEKVAYLWERKKNTFVIWIFFQYFVERGHQGRKKLYKNVSSQFEIISFVVNMTFETHVFAHDKRVIYRVIVLLQ